MIMWMYCLNILLDSYMNKYWCEILKGDYFKFIGMYIWFVCLLYVNLIENVFYI